MINETKETIQIDGITYVVEASGTPESYEAQGLQNLAAHMREYKQAKQLYLRRPKGSKTYFAIQDIHSGYSSVVKLAGF